MKLYVGIDVNENGVCLAALSENRQVVFSRCENSSEEALLNLKKVFSVFKNNQGLFDEDISSVALISPDPVLRMAVGADAVISKIVSMKAFEQLKKEGINFENMPECDGCARAIGAAVLGKNEVENAGNKTKFYGFGLINDAFQGIKFSCYGCGNCCEVTRLKINDKTVGFADDSCGKWKSSLR